MAWLHGGEYAPRFLVRTPKPAPDLIDWEFTSGIPDQRWAGDTSYIPTDEGWLYLVVILDVGSRRALGHTMAEHLRTELVTDCLNTAMRLRGGHIAG